MNWGQSGGVAKNVSDSFVGRVSAAPPGVYPSLSTLVSPSTIDS